MSREYLPRSRRQYVQGMNSPALSLARSLRGAKSSGFPHFVEPSLATLAAQSPQGDQWVHEIKYDGYRFQCHVHRGIRFYTRRGYDWSDRLDNIVTALQPFAQHAIMFDGEVVVQTPDGHSDFHALEKELKRKDGSDRLVYFVFDILYYEAFDLRGAAFLDRKRVLAEVLRGIEGPVKLSEHLEGNGPTIWRRACDLGLEGIVSKRADARYYSGRTPVWIKTTCRHRDTFAVVGWAQKNGRFDGIYLGRAEDGKLVYAGKLEHGFSEEDKRNMLQRLEPLRVRNKPVASARNRFPKAQWVTPQVFVDAEFRGKTGEGLLRHASFKGIREDLVGS
jgi:bifunctional non-homologous end joining protein LigD